LTGEHAIMQRYEKALELTRSMLEAAQKSEWQRLVELERERAILIDELRELDRDPGRDMRERERKRALLREIMQLDEQVELLTKDWMRELREVLGSISAEQRLSRTYGPSSA
jgi:Flagellar protein FliT